MLHIDYDVEPDPSSRVGPLLRIAPRDRAQYGRTNRLLFEARRGLPWRVWGYPSDERATALLRAVCFRWQPGDHWEYRLLAAKRDVETFRLLAAAPITWWVGGECAERYLSLLRVPLANHPGAALSGQNERLITWWDEQIGRLCRGIELTIQEFDGWKEGNQ
jgi:hypothetical protein